MREMPRLRAASTRGVITARELVSIGVPESTIYHRCHDGGPWQVLLPGVILLSTGPATREQRLTAALKYTDTPAVVTGLEACHRHGVRRGPAPDDRVHVLVPHSRQVSSSGFVVVERTIRLPDPVVVHGFPLAPVARACIDSVRRLRSVGEITELVADSVQRRLTTVTELGIELESGSRTWTSMPRRVLDQVGAGVRSAAELQAKRLIERSWLPAPMWNASIYTADGEWLGIADCWFDDVTMLWEIDSTEWHLSPADHDRTVAKAARFVAGGAVQVPTKPSSLWRDERSVITTLVSAYRHAAARPRPPLRAVPVEGR